ncbi:hypothetical protein [Roseibium alexandrii]|uniref:hypothetical protein n=1 Tax=Roseibium alexandrii TaxID=388408 RepID=UPI00375195E8
MTKDEFQTVRKKWIRDDAKCEITEMPDEAEQKIIENLDQIDRDIAERPEILIPLTQEMYQEMRRLAAGIELDMDEPIIEGTFSCSGKKEW